ncbi:tegument protein US22 [Cercopithecine betaherpesvirus 5]|uniref:Tegument protein US22 n=1 Tax=Simian cytomegalovirus (strain Colburn) TaxID=50292 RepID=G8XTM8_SCMVC|nr:tegument protein US22 [Cercopithecine betaherpesvirus 5]AEV80520.1 tegument protein US22 [Cercopithecine betaherpesvirus 5]
MAMLSRAAAEAWSTYLKQRDERPEDVIRCDYGVFNLRNIVFQRAMSLLQGVFLRQYDSVCLRDYVKKNSGTIIPLRNPSTWFLIFRHSADIPQVEGRQFGPDYMCCDEKLEAVGILAVKLPDGDRKRVQETTCVLLVGQYGFVYVYDWDSDGLFQIANSVKELAQYGLIMCESVYRHPQTPFATTEPRHQIEKFLCLDPTDAHAVAKVAEEFHGLNLVIKTPGRSEADPLLLLGSVENLRMVYPFAKMRPGNYEDLISYINQRLCCRWYVLGITGRYAAFGVLLTCGVIVLDECGVCYVLRIDDCDLYRVADSIHMLFKCGFLKLRGMLRFDRGMRGESRLEHAPSCDHYNRREDLSWCSMLGTVSRDQLESAYDWLTRTSRCYDKIPTSPCWGRTDLLPTGVLQENQNWCFPWNSVTPLAAPQHGAWEEHDELTAKVRSFRVFRVSKGYAPRTLRGDEETEDEYEDTTGEEGNEPEENDETADDDNHTQPSSPLHNGSVGDSEDVSSLSEDEPFQPPPELVALIKKEWQQDDEQATSEREIWLRRGKRAQAMLTCYSHLKRVSIYDPLNIGVNCFD